ncbi:MAG TPA: fibronectin type III domain-containing protein [Micromonosporaceae bacterium]|nr:fibronectin type III domain-containing protein [Micromonosporaceae bacterium]
MTDRRRWAPRLRQGLDRVARSRPHRGRLPLVALLGVTALGLAAAVSGTAASSPTLRFTQAGHWFANPTLDMVFHVNGAARAVDAQVAVAGIEPGDQVVQGETSGFVVGRSRILQFGKSSLAVEETRAAPTGERPVAVEAAGGPYVVYREAGTVVRLGDMAATIPVGGTLADPVTTPDGTLWLHRLGDNVICRLPPGAGHVSCSATAADGHAGALTVVGDRPMFVDAEEDTIRPVTHDGLGPPTKIAVDIPLTVRVAPVDVDGRIAMLDPVARRLHLVTSGEPGSGREAAAPITVALPEGTYTTPSASGSSFVLLDLARNTVLTYGSSGERQQTAVVPRDAGEPRLSRGEDKRVYIDGAEGRHVLVVDQRGEVQPVSVVGRDQSAAPGTPQPPPTEPQPAQPNQAPTAAGVPVPRPNEQGGRPDERGRLPGTPARAQPTKAANTVQPRPAPSAVPASPPGMPPNVRAAVAGAAVSVTWGAASANGAEVSAYHVTWAPVSGSGGGSTTRAGGDRSMTVTGLAQGVAYRFTVAAQNSAGRGAPATTQATVPAPSRTVTVSRGGDATWGTTCRAPNCAFILVVLRGFAPNTAYHIKPHSANYSNPGATLTTDRNGNLTSSSRFPFGQVGQDVWVTVVPAAGGATVESNHYRWRVS